MSASSSAAMPSAVLKLKEKEFSICSKGSHVLQRCSARHASGNGHSCDCCGRDFGKDTDMEWEKQDERFYCKAGTCEFDICSKCIVEYHLMNALHIIINRHSDTNTTHSQHDNNDNDDNIQALTHAIKHLQVTPSPSSSSSSSSSSSEKDVCPNSFVISAHGDTNFRRVLCRAIPIGESTTHTNTTCSSGARSSSSSSSSSRSNRLLYGHMDNFAGVHCAMNAYFSGLLPSRSTVSPSKVEPTLQCNDSSVRIEITYGEEGDIDDMDFTGARQLVRDLRCYDCICVLDVTGATTESNIVIEKCKSPLIRYMIQEALGAPPRLIDGKPYNQANASTRDNNNTKDAKLESKGEAVAPAAKEELSGDAMLPLFSPYFTYDLCTGCTDPQAMEDESDIYQHRSPFTFFLGIKTFGGTFGGLTSDGDYNAGPVFAWQQDLKAVEVALIRLANLFESKYKPILYNYSILARECTGITAITTDKKQMDEDDEDEDDEEPL